VTASRLEDARRATARLAEGLVRADHLHAVARLHAVDQVARKHNVCEREEDRDQALDNGHPGGPQRQLPPSPHPPNRPHPVDYPVQWALIRTLTGPRETRFCALAGACCPIGHLPLPQRTDGVGQLSGRGTFRRLLDCDHLVCLVDRQAKLRKQWVAIFVLWVNANKKGGLGKRSVARARALSGLVRLAKQKSYVALGFSRAL